MTNKVALITGSASGLGKRTAIELASQGTHIIINYVHSNSKAEQFAAYLSDQFSISTLCIQGDIGSVEGAQDVVQEALKHWESIDILINNAGPYVTERKKMVDYAIDEWKSIIDGNLNAAFYLSRLIIPKMREQRWGRIINIGFDRADSAPGWKYRSAFAAAKVGLVSLTKSIALEEADYGITANMICPGDIIEPYKEMKIEEVLQIKDKYTPIGRPGTGQDIARAIAFLCDEHSDFITGSIIQVTGGKDVLNKYMSEEVREDE